MEEKKAGVRRELERKKESSSMHLEVSNPVSNILVAGGLLIGQFDSIADCTQEGLATHSEVSRTIDNHLQTLNLKEECS